MLDMVNKRQWVELEAGETPGVELPEEVPEDGGKEHQRQRPQANGEHRRRTHGARQGAVRLDGDSRSIDPQLLNYIPHFSCVL